MRPAEVAVGISASVKSSVAMHMNKGIARLPTVWERLTESATESAEPLWQHSWVCGLSSTV